MKIKKILTSFLLFAVALFLIVPSAFAAGTYFAEDSSGNIHTVEYEGIVPCNSNSIKIDGAPGEVSCQLCHLFVMVDNVLDVIFTVLAPPIFVLLVVAGGAMIVFSTGNESYVSRGKDLIKAAVIGIAIMFAAFMIIEIAISAFGFAEIKGSFNPSNWFTIKCEIKI